LGEEPRKVVESEDKEEVPDWEQEKRKELYDAYIAFEKKRGDKASIEILSSRKNVRHTKKESLTIQWITMHGLSMQDWNKKTKTP